MQIHITPHTSNNFNNNQCYPKNIYIYNHSKPDIMSFSSRTLKLKSDKTGKLSDTSNVKRHLEILDEIRFLFLNKKSSKEELIKSYPSLATDSNSLLYVFNLDNNSENIKNISILTRHNKLGRLRFWVTQKDGSSKEFLVDDYNKVIRNPKAKSSDISYLTTKEIKNLNIETYLTLAKQELEKFLQYANKKATQILKKTNVQKNTTNPIQMLIELEKESIPCPAHVDEIKSALTGKSIGYKLKTSNGEILKIKKRVQYRTNLPSIYYYCFEKINQNGEKHYLLYDYKNNQFFKPTSQGQIFETNNEVYVYNQETVDTLKLNTKLAQIIKEIFTTKP